MPRAAPLPHKNGSHVPEAKWVVTLAVTAVDSTSKKSQDTSPRGAFSLLEASLQKQCQLLSALQRVWQALF